MSEKNLELEQLPIYRRQGDDKVKAITLSSTPDGGLIAVCDKYGIPIYQIGINDERKVVLYAPTLTRIDSAFPHQ